MARAVGPSLEVAAALGVQRRYERLLADSPKGAQKAGARALRRTLRSGKAAASRAIRVSVRLKKKIVDQRIDARVISIRALTGVVAVRDRKVELIEFLTPSQIANAYRRQRAKTRRSKGVRVKTSSQESARVYPGTFVEIGRQDRRWHVLKRQGRDAYPVFIQYGPNLARQYEKDLPAFAEDQARALGRNAQHEFDRLEGLV